VNGMDAKLIFCGLALVGISCAHREAAPVAVVQRAEVVVARPAVVRLAERAVILGQSVENRAITLNVLGDSTDVTLIIGAIHGNEATSGTVAQRLVEYLRLNPEKLAGRCVAVIAVANPDGVARGLRTNKNLVDLNRNFPAANWAKTRKGVNFGGERAGSEPETAAVLKAFELMKPARVVSIHSMDKPCNNYDGPARLLAEVMSRSNGYMVKDNIGYPTPGSLGSWAGIDRGIPIVTLELLHSMNGEKAWEGNRVALLSVIVSGRSEAE
jgi:protein MpaA